MLVHVLNKRNAAFVKSVILYMVALVIAVGLKYHYSHAHSNDLDWILGPTASLVTHLSGIRFEKTDGEGFVNHPYRVVIAPSCAGVNFLIITFCMAAFLGLNRLRSIRSKILWLGNSAVSAYFLTITINSLRIIFSVYTYHADMHYGWLTPERLHRIEGIFIYFFFLCLFYLGIDKTILFLTRNKNQEKEKKTTEHSNNTRVLHAAGIPLFWYLLVSLGIPLLNRAYHNNGPQFVEHGVVVVSVCMLVFLFLFFIQLFCTWIKGRICEQSKRSSFNVI